LYCSTPTLDLSQAAQLIHRTSLPDHKALIAGYQLYYYKEIKKDIDGFIRAQISVWNATSAPLDRNEFDSDLTTLLHLHSALPIYKEVAKIIKHQPALLASPQSLFLLARLYEQQRQPRKALRWLRKTEQLIPDTALQLQIIALRHKIRS
jgi:tetratricopeptide (TPR) repeat protein